MHGERVCLRSVSVSTGPVNADVIPLKPASGGSVTFEGNVVQDVRAHGPSGPVSPPAPAPDGWAKLARFGVLPLLLALDLLAVAVGVLGMEWLGRQVGDDSPSR